MGAPAELTGFVRAALEAGHERPAIRAAMEEAGWSAQEAQAALDAWADTGFRPPVPRPRALVSARAAFAYGLMFVALLVVVGNAASAVFEIIEMALADPPDPGFQMRRIAWELAALIVFLPVFALLERRLGRQSAADPGARRSALRKGFAYLTLFLAALILLGNLVYAIYGVLSGGADLEGLLKSLTVALIALAVLLYFRSYTRVDETAG